MIKTPIIKKIFKVSPLPFMGQKRNYLTAFKQALEKYPKNAIYVDLFGGSGLLSRTVKDYYQEATVIYNDYDNFRERIEAIPTTNTYLEQLRIVLKNAPRGIKITEPFRSEVLELFEKNTGFVDYQTISSSLLFAMNTVTDFKGLSKATLYNKIRKSNYNADGYLNGLKVVKMDYKDLFAKYKSEKSVVFLVDPPYLSTDCSTYKNYWKLKDYLDVLTVLDGTNYFYFTSNKSSIIELCEWISHSTFDNNPFDNAEKKEMKANTTSNTSYTDIMLHKGWTSTVS